MRPRRNTIQRTRILEYLRGVHTHPTVEDIYNVIKKEIPTISLATIYRNLNVLEQNGEVMKLEVNNEAHYDAVTCFHQHGICRSCHKILDADKSEIADIALKGCSIADFEPDFVQIIYYGICKECIEKDSSRHKKNCC